MTRNIDELKQGLKAGTISYFTLNQDEIEKVTEALKNDIKSDEAEIENIKSKIDEEKKKIENNNNI